MDTTLKHNAFAHDRSANKTAAAHSSAVAQKILYVLFIVIPAAAGADKFFNVLTDWPKYISPMFASMVPLEASLSMKIAGVIEIGSALLVAFKPKIGGYVVALWLILIDLQLIIGWHFVDIAVRDIAMAAAAYCLALLSTNKNSDKL